MNLGRCVALEMSWDLHIGGSEKESDKAGDIFFEVVYVHAVLVVLFEKLIFAETGIGHVIKDLFKYGKCKRLLVLEFGIFFWVDMFFQNSLFYS